VTGTTVISPDGSAAGAARLHAEVAASTVTMRKKKKVRVS